MALPVVLALDLASTTGWCLGRLGEAPTYGTWSLGSDDWTNRFQRLADSIVSKVDGAARRGTPITRLVYEAPLPRQQKSEAVAALAWGFAAITIYVAGRLKIWHAPRNCGEARAAVLGTARFPKGQVKQEVDRLCRLQGWKIDQDDARDAFVVWKAEELRVAPQHGQHVRLAMRLETPSIPGI